MKRGICLLLALIMTMSLCACGGKQEESAGALTWQEQYDLGIRYLSEGNYEEAIIAFMAAIEIDPKQPDAYLKAAEAYEAVGDLDGAKAVLQQGVETTGADVLQVRLSALSKAEQPVVGELPTEPMEIPVAVDGTLALSNVTCVFDPEAAKAHNPGAVGGMRLDFIVEGPEEVGTVFIAGWREGGFEEAERNEYISLMVQVWNEESHDWASGGRQPFPGGSTFPVDPEERGKTVDVLLVGLNEDGEAAAYATITVSIP